MTKPAAPEDTRNVCASHDALGVSWTYTDPDPDHFELTSEPMGQPPLILATIPGNHREYVIPGTDPVDPRPGVMLAPVLYAVDADGIHSDGARFTTLPRPPRNPVPATGLTLRLFTDSGYAVIGFNYDPDGTTPATTFELEELGGEGWTHVATAGPITAPATSGEFVFTTDTAASHTWNVTATYADGRRARSAIIGTGPAAI